MTRFWLTAAAALVLAIGASYVFADLNCVQSAAHQVEAGFGSFIKRVITPIPVPVPVLVPPPHIPFF